MKSFALSLLAAVIVSALAFAPVGKAHAADKYVATLTNDGGTTGHSFTRAVTKMTTAALQCPIPACYKTGTSTPLALNCAQDAILPGSNRNDQVTFNPTNEPTAIEMGADSYIAVKSLDGGSPDCVLFNRTKNPQNLR